MCAAPTQVQAPRFRGLEPNRPTPGSTLRALRYGCCSSVKNGLNKRSLWYKDWNLGGESFFSAYGTSYPTMEGYYYNDWITSLVVN